MHRLLALALVLGGSLSVAAETRVIVSVRMATDSEEEPVAGAVVSFVPDTLGASPKPVASASTDLNGLAALAIASGQYVVTASAPGFETLSTQAILVGIDSALNFVLTPADPDAVIPDVRTRVLSSGTAAVSGRLLTIGGAPLRGATVGLSETSLSARGNYGRSTTPAEDGTFRAVAPFVPSGTYTLTVRPSLLPVQGMPPIIFVSDVDEYSIRVPVAPDQDMPVGDIRLPAHAQYRLRVTVADGSGRIPAETQVEVYRPRTSTDVHKS